MELTVEGLCGGTCTTWRLEIGHARMERTNTSKNVVHIWTFSVFMARLRVFCARGWAQSQTCCCSSELQCLKPDTSQALTASWIALVYLPLSMPASSSAAARCLFLSESVNNSSTFDFRIS